MPGAEVGVPSLIGELTIRNAAGRESYVFKRGESLHIELTVRNLWNQKYGDARGKSLGQVKPGVYRVIAQYRGRLAKSGQCVSVMRTFRIE